MRQPHRDLLVRTSRRVFADARVALEVIAREAGVGIGMWYRHFPTREALIEAVYEAELDDVTASGTTLLAAHADAVDIGPSAWMDCYVALVAVKHGLVDTLRVGWLTGAGTTPRTRERITGVIPAFLAAGAQQGVLLSTASSGTPQQMPQLLNLLLDGLRRRPSLTI